MNVNNRFSMHNSKTVINCLLVGAGAFILLPVVFTIFQGIDNTLMYIVCGICATPFIVASFRFIPYRVSVCKTNISVRKGLFKKFSLDVSEIENITWIASATKFGQNENITVRTPKGKFKVESLMVGSQKMIDFLKANVDKSKIQMRIKNFNS